MRIKIYNENGNIKIVKETDTGNEITMFSNVQNGEVAIIDIQSPIALKAELDSISY